MMKEKICSLKGVKLLFEKEEAKEPKVATNEKLNSAVDFMEELYLMDPFCMEGGVFNDNF